MDRDLYVSARRNSQKENEIRAAALHFITDFQPYLFEKMPINELFIYTNCNLTSLVDSNQLNIWEF